MWWDKERIDDWLGEKQLTNSFETRDISVIQYTTNNKNVFIEVEVKNNLLHQTQKQKILWQFWFSLSSFQHTVGYVNERAWKN